MADSGKRTSHAYVTSDLDARTEGKLKSHPESQSFDSGLKPAGEDVDSSEADATLEADWHGEPK